MIYVWQRHVHISIDFEPLFNAAIFSLRQDGSKRRYIDTLMIFVSTRNEDIIIHVTVSYIFLSLLPVVLVSSHGNQSHE